MLNGESWHPVAHRPSHAHLVRQNWPEVHPASVCGVVVPASRPSRNLAAAVSLAEDLGCPVVVACSGRALVAEVAAELERWQGVAFVMPAQQPTAVRRLRTRQLALNARRPGAAEDRRVPGASRPGLRSGAGSVTGSAEGHDARFDGGRAGLDLVEEPTPYLDASTKRNIALLLARQLGWRRLLFLDDDIQPPSAEQINRAVSMLGPGGAAMASWPARDFPDNSVVCHARRSVGLPQGTFLAGGCLLADLTRPLPFFPAVYNEDWLFCWEAVRDRRMALPGSVAQAPYNPFDPRRAAREEFGDVLGEGLFSLLHRSPTDLLLSLAGGAAGEMVEPARHRGYWELVLAGRRAMLAEVCRRLEQRVGSEPDAGGRLEAVRSGQERLALITADELAQFVAIWLEDLHTWRYELAQLRRRDSFKAALGELGIDDFRRVGVM